MQRARVSKKSVNTMPLLLSVKAAAHIGVQYRQLLAAVNAGEIPTYRLRRSRELVDVQEIMALMRKQGAESTKRL